MFEHLTLRPAESRDEEFLFRVYSSTRTEELALTNWSDAQKESFLRMQFRAQDEHYRKNYTDARFDLILWSNEPIGRLYVANWPSEIRVMDIGLLPPFRGRGIGQYLLERQITEASTTRKTLSIHVEHFNRAIRLYERLGFYKVREVGLYYLMEWRDRGHDRDEAASTSPIQATP